MLRERVRAGGTIIMTTHILEVAERMADRIGVIAHGKLIAEGTLEELRLAGRQKAASRTPTPERRSLEDTFLALVAEQAASGMTRSAGHAVWFARHESRLAWRDWLAMMTAGRRERLRRVVIAIAVFVDLHAFRRLLDGRPLRRCRRRQGDAGRRSPPACCCRGS